MRRLFVEKIEKVHEKNVADIMDVLLEKLQTLAQRTSLSASVSNNFGEVLIGKGAKFNQKNLSADRLSER
ncbi:MAG: hypothetical protein WKG06_00505 [Segetibacter sp.]